MILMSSVNPDWKLLTLKFNRALVEVLMQQYVGEKLIGEKRLALHPSDLTLRLTKSDNDAFHGLNTESLRNEMHYDLPEHPLLNGVVLRTVSSDET